MSARRPPPLRRVRLMVGGLLAASLATSVHADVESDYGRGWTAYRQRNWKVVVEAMTAAIAQRPEERGMINIGSNNNQPYLPHFYQGIGRFQLGDCRGALESWKKSLEQGYLRKFRQEDQEFSRYYPICETQVEVETNLAEAQAARTRVELLAKDPHLARVWTSEAGLGPAAARAGEQLPKVQSDLELARREREDRRVTALIAVRTTSAAVRQQLERVEQDAKQRQQALIAEARPRPPVPPPVTPAPSEGPLASVGTRTAPTVPVSTTPLAPPRPEPPPDQLRAGIQRFVNGRYREAIDVLSTVPSGGRWRAQAALFRSAANFSLFRATNEQVWRTRAVDAARECVRLAPGTQADERLLSPAFRRFFTEAVRAEHAGSR